VGLAIGREELSFAEQSKILLDIKAGMADDPSSREDAMRLLDNFRHRPDLFARIEREIEELLVSKDQIILEERAFQEGGSKRASQAPKQVIVNISDIPTRTSRRQLWRRPSIVVPAVVTAANFLVFSLLDMAGAWSVTTRFLSLLAGLGGYFGARSYPRLHPSMIIVSLIAGVGGFSAGGSLAESAGFRGSGLFIAAFIIQSLCIYAFLGAWGILHKILQKNNGSPSP
jgi:hypothetical protein